MSLIVANCSGGTIKVVSDTRLSDPVSRLPRGHLDGALKILLLSQELGFAFAGDPTPALEALKALHDATMHKPDFTSLASFLLKKNVESGHSTDFVVFSMVPKPQLCKVSNGCVSNDQSQFWIGDPEAFNCYQEHFHSLVSQLPNHLRQNPEHCQHQMNAAMREVIDTTTIQSVGDLLVPVSSHGDGLQYVSYARISIFPTDEPAGDGWFKMRGGTAEEGGSSISMLTPYDRTVPAVAFHFSEGRFGVLYCPSMLQGPAVIKEVDVDSFTAQVSLVHGINLQGQVHLH